MADGPRAVRFALADYDRSLPLVIDPTIEFASYLGTGGDEEVLWTETRGGSVYVSGRTWRCARRSRRSPPCTGDDTSSPHCFVSKFTAGRQRPRVVRGLRLDRDPRPRVRAVRAGPELDGPRRRPLRPQRRAVGREPSSPNPTRAAGTWVGSNFSVPELQPDRPVADPDRQRGNTYLVGSCNPGAYAAGDVVLPNGERTVAHLTDCSSSSPYGNPATFESLLLKIAPDGIDAALRHVHRRDAVPRRNRRVYRPPARHRPRPRRGPRNGGGLGGRLGAERRPAGDLGGGLIDVSLHLRSIRRAGTSTTTAVHAQRVRDADSTRRGPVPLAHLRARYYGIRFASEGRRRSGGTAPSRTGSPSRTWRSSPAVASTSSATSCARGGMATALRPVRRAHRPE